jgi:2-phosphoglycerate kinase
MLTRKDQLTLLNTLKEKAMKRSKEEYVCAFEIIQDISDYIENIKDKNLVPNVDDHNIHNSDRISRSFIYFHHIKSPNKKKNIV